MKSSLLNFIITLLVSLILFSVAGYYLTGFIMDVADFGSSNEIIDPTDSENTDETTTHDPNVVHKELDCESFTVALIGTDYQPSLFEDYNIEDNYTDTFPEIRNREYSADAIAVVRYDKDSQTLLITSIPPSLALNKDFAPTLGSTFNEDEIQSFLNNLSTVTGFEFDNYFVVRVGSFASMVNKIVNYTGAISFDVPENMQYEDELQNLNINLYKGEQTLNGGKAEQLIRFDDYSNSSHSRALTTSNFLMAVLEALSSSSTVELTELYSSLVNNIIKHNYSLSSLEQHLEIIQNIEHVEKIVYKYPGNYINDIFDPNVNQAINYLADYR